MPRSRSSLPGTGPAKSLFDSGEWSRTLPNRPGSLDPRVPRQLGQLGVAGLCRAEPDRQERLGSSSVHLPGCPRPASLRATAASLGHRHLPVGSSGRGDGGRPVAGRTPFPRIRRPSAFDRYRGTRASSWSTMSAASRQERRSAFRRSATAWSACRTAWATSCTRRLICTANQPCRTAPSSRRPTRRARAALDKATTRIER
jgi:hypothetical protein